MEPALSEQAAILAASRDGPAARGPPRDFVVGHALVQPSLNRISIEGRTAQVEPKVMQVLTLMASRPGAVIARETFLETVWAGTAADDYLLNRAISELRKIFGDDAQTPRYIETIRKRGYRLIAPIAPAKVVTALAAEPAPRAPAETAATPGPAPDTHEATPPSRSPPTAAALAGAGVLIVFGLVAALLLRSQPDSSAQPAPAQAYDQTYDILPLTSFVGREIEPALSPDGSRVAFVWDGGTNGSFDVYVKAVGSESVLALTASAADERYPVWSADGRSLLFARPGEQGLAIMQVSALGGAATRVLTDTTVSEIRGMSVSPDGQWVAYAARRDAAAPYRITLAALGSGAPRILTTPDPGSLGDIDPLFSRDGRSLAFIRAVNEVTKDVHLMALDDETPRRITFDNRKIGGLAWTPDGKRLLFPSTRSGMYRLWTLDPQGGEPQLAWLGDERVQEPATAPGVELIVFEEWMHRAQLRRIDVARGVEIQAGNYIGSTRWDAAPSHAPDGTRIAFNSNRSGPPGIWVSERDGRNAVQIASLGGAFVEHPAWSPDGRWIAFDASPDGRTSIFTVPADGGAPQRVTTGPGDSRNPSWSRDGSWLYFESNRSGAWRIYAQPAAGGEPIEIAPGLRPRESVDGAWLLYAKADADGLWRRPRRAWQETVAGAEELLVEHLAPQDVMNWAPGRHGVYFIRRPADGPPVLSFLDDARGATTDVFTLTPAFEGWGLDLSPDEKELVIAELLMQESDLRVAVPRSTASPQAD